GGAVRLAASTSALQAADSLFSTTKAIGLIPGGNSCWKSDTRQSPNIFGRLRVQSATTIFTGSANLLSKTEPDRSLRQRHETFSQQSSRAPHSEANFSAARALISSASRQ